MKTRVFLFLVVVILVVVGWSARGRVRNFWFAFKNGPVPQEKFVPQIAPQKNQAHAVPIIQESAPQKSASATGPEKEINLPVPFTPQAPHAEWGLPYQEACEEASLIMAYAYVKGAPSADMPWTADEADKEILKLVDWENKTFGYYKDTTAAEVARMAKEYFGIGAQVVENPTAEAIKDFLRAGKLVLVPAYGVALDQPNFRGGGPLYHMLVVKGFTADGRFITNDPGTRNGRNFTYSEQNLMDSMHDWNGGNVKHGAKRVVVIGK